MSGRLWWAARLVRLLRVACTGVGLIGLSAMLGGSAGPVVGVVGFVAGGVALYLVPESVERAALHG
jgi:hypothetical protein